MYKLGLDKAEELEIKLPIFIGLYKCKTIPDILEYEVKRALGSITMNKASGGDGIPAELFKILNDDAVKVLNPTCTSSSSLFKYC